ncbi:MAG TPA: enhanced serine sensitivity protein SseB [Janthinobacterium sp.]|nr:enhanced serine sensitivity protein SseB [Janthinobacterium sp.]
MPVAENHLEHALRMAADDPDLRADFYLALLAADVYIIGEAETLEAGEQISIQSWMRQDGGSVIPFFTSLAALRRALSPDDADCGYLLLSARALFEVTRGTALVLNPKSDYGKEFPADEIAALLLADADEAPQERLGGDVRQVLLGQPKVYPSQMIDALTTLLAKRAEVRTAYLALMHDPAVDARPHLLLGLRTDSHGDEVLREACALARDCAPPGETVNVTRIIDGEHGLSQYFLHNVEPFYERTWGARLKEMPAAGHA